MDTGLTLVNLADFTGKPSSYYGRFVTEALAQATDLFELGTCLTEMPTDGLNLRLAQRGILSMTEVLYEGQASRDLRFSPYKTETIGSYSYSLAEAAVLQGIPTGISWFDLALSRLKVGVPTVGNSSIHAFDRPGDLAERHGELYLPGPADSESYKGSPAAAYHRLGADSGYPSPDDTDWLF